MLAPYLIGHRQPCDMDQRGRICAHDLAAGIQDPPRGLMDEICRFKTSAQA
jgi:hypothetical protein